MVATSISFLMFDPANFLLPVCRALTVAYRRGRCKDGSGDRQKEIGAEAPISCEDVRQTHGAVCGGKLICSAMHFLFDGGPVVPGFAVPRGGLATTLESV